MSTKRWEAKRFGKVGDFLAARGGAKDRRTKDLLPEYVKNLQAVVAQIEKEESTGKDDEKPKSEAEEDAWFKKKRQGFKEKEQRILQEKFERTFGTWKESDWKTFEDAYDGSLLSGIPLGAIIGISREYPDVDLLGALTPEGQAILCSGTAAS
jgi:hypothetical protein